MTRERRLTGALACLSVAAVNLAGCALPPLQPVATAREQAPPYPAVAGPPAQTPRPTEVGAVILPGRPQASTATETITASAPRGGEVSLDFPNVDVQSVAKAVLGDILHVPYSVGPDVHTSVTLAPGHRIPRSSVLTAFELALANAGLALVAQPTGGYAILPADQAKAVAPVGDSGEVGYASEAVKLQFVNAEELRKLIDPVLPGVVTGADANANAETLTIAGTEGQRAAARDLVREFDVDWLRGASFALFVPRRTDARLIVPELDKVLNGDGAPTRGQVRLIAMDRLNGVLAVATQPQYLDDVRRWVEILDREGEASTRRLFVYRVQNGRAGDLARTLAAAFGKETPKGGANGGLGFSDTSRPPGVIGALPSDSPGSSAPSSGVGQGGSGQNGGASSSSGSSSSSNSGGAPSGGTNLAGDLGAGAGGASAAPVSVQVDADDFHAKITSDEGNNAIVVYATPKDYAIVEDALRKLDIPPTQVVIEAAIAEVTLTDSLQFGVQALFNNLGLSVGLTQGATTSAVSTLTPGFNAVAATRTISAALSTLEGLTTVKVISAPKLMVLNNQTASIEVGTQVPILTGSATSVITADAPIVNSVDYRDTGIILKITPRVNSSGFVLLDIAQEVSGVIPASGAASSIGSPSFSTRRVATSVAVQDGRIVALGGMISDNRNDTSTGLPGLSRIPVLGPLLFGNINNTDTRTELIVLLRPTVVRSADDAKAVTDELREKLKAIRGLLPDPKSMP